MTTGDNSNSTVQNTIDKYNKDIEDKKLALKALKSDRDTIAKDITNGRTLLARLKKKLTKLRSTRKKSNGGIDSQMAVVLKSIGVEPTQYHGCNLAGMDIKKLIANASFVFDEFPKILKASKKEDSITNPGIDLLCKQHRELFLLWDGTFSLARMW